MPKVCDQTSVGVLVWKDGKLLMIERKIYNPGFAIPAGHQDGQTPLDTAQNELFEEVGLSAQRFVEKLRCRLQNPCRRSGGIYHDWTIFEAKNWSGDIVPSPDETKSYLWADRETIRGFAKRLEEFAKGKNIALQKDALPLVVDETNSDPEWKKSPGIEPPMYFLLKDLAII